MKTARLLAILLCVVALVAGVAFMLGKAAVLGGLTAIAGLVLGIVAGPRPATHDARRRVVQAFIAFAAALFLFGTLGLVFAPAVTVIDWLLAAGGFGGWLAARRQSRRQEIALQYMNYIRD